MIRPPCRQAGVVPLMAAVTLFLAPGTAGGETADVLFDSERQRMVDTQLKARGIRDRRVLEAMKKVKRHLFVEPGLERAAYEDHPLPIGHGQTISQPYIAAFMTEAARIGPEDRVLEIGTGSGYQAAVLSELAREVYTVEIIEPLARGAAARLERLGVSNVRVRHGDGWEGRPEEAPFDVIIVTAAPPRVPEKLVEQLKIGGRMVVPVGDLFQDLVLVTKTAAGAETKKLLPVRFVPMVEDDTIGP